MLRISEIFIYPIKSLGGIQLNRALVTDRGLQYDRRWMLVDEQNRFLTQREHPRMALLKTSIREDMLSIVHSQENENNILVPLVLTDGETLRVTVWDDVCDAIPGPTEANEWFSQQLSIRCKLVFMPAGSHRQVDPLYASCAQDITSFSDGYPILLIGQPALTQLNTKLSEPLPMNRFRPSIVFTGGEPHYEDMIKRFRINEVNFSGVKLCGRCTVTTTDQDTGTRGKEPLKTLATYRSINNKICFGQNVIAHDTGHINVGDEILVQ